VDFDSGGRRVVVVLLARQADHEAVLAAPVDVVLAAVALDQHERHAVALVAARVEVHAVARPGGDVRVGVPLDGRGLLALRRLLHVEDPVGRVGRGLRRRMGERAGELVGVRLLGHLGAGARGGGRGVGHGVDGHRMLS